MYIMYVLRLMETHLGTNGNTHRVAWWFVPVRTSYSRREDQLSTVVWDQCGQHSEISLRGGGREGRRRGKEKEKKILLSKRL